MNDRTSTPFRKSAYILVPATSIAENDLIEFATALQPDGPTPDRLLASWWRGAEPHCAVAAVHEETGAMVGLCGGRPCNWIIGGRSYPAVAICDWFVDPKHGGKLIGKRMVQHFQRPDRMLYAISISDIAIAYLQRLGWVGPNDSCLMVVPLPRISRLALSLSQRQRDLELGLHVVS